MLSSKIDGFLSWWLFGEQALWILIPLQAKHTRYQFITRINGRKVRFRKDGLQAYELPHKPLHHHGIHSIWDLLTVSEPDTDQVQWYLTWQVWRNVVLSKCYAMQCEEYDIPFNLILLEDDFSMWLFECVHGGLNFRITLQDSNLQKTIVCLINFKRQNFNSFKNNSFS